MHTEFLMGNEAIALGALAAGVNVVCGNGPSTRKRPWSSRPVPPTPVPARW